MQLIEVKYGIVTKGSGKICRENQRELVADEATFVVDIIFERDHHKMSTYGMAAFMRMA